MGYYVLSLLIVPYGIETSLHQLTSISKKLLIVPYGIETDISGEHISFPCRFF